MRQASTYRGARRNKVIEINGKRKRAGRNMVRERGSLKKDSNPTHILFIPPTQPNKRLPEGQIRHKRMVVPV